MAAAPLSGANVDIGDGEILNSASDTSPADESISNINIASISSQPADSAEPSTSKACLQVTSDGDIIMDEESSEIIKRKKLSLTLPLLNIVDTAGAACPSGDAAASPNGTIAGPSTSSSCKTKKIYESDDTFIQTIFSQTIKSTTVTPTDDDPSYAFEDFHGTRIRGSISSQQTKSDSLMTDDTPVEKLETPIDGMSPSTIVKTSFFDKRLSETSEILQIDGSTSPPSDKPTETFAYFHQTIDEDEPPLSDVVDVETVAAVEDDATADAAAADDNHSPVDACLDEFIDSPDDMQTNTESLTNATCANANATNTITVRTASCITQITLSSPSPVLESPESEQTFGQCGDGGGGGGHNNDDCSNVNDNTQTNTNASNTEHGNDASEQINAADAISSYDDEHTETEQNNSLTSNNSSLHVSSVVVPNAFCLFFLLLPLLCKLIDFSVGIFVVLFFIQIIIILSRAG